jgi:hypothetical protein
MGDYIKPVVYGFIIGLTLSSFIGCSEGHVEAKASLRQTASISETHRGYTYQDCMDVPKDVEPIPFPEEGANCFPIDHNDPGRIDPPPAE